MHMDLTGVRRRDTDMANLGRLERVDLRSAWASEAAYFTPWLAQEQNIKLLSDTIGLDLEVQSTEQEVGPFRADILCKETASDGWVLIENQLERTDHTHLGQLMTYAAGLNVVTIVWIAQRFTDEHRAALDWLNEITGEEINLFGLEVELWRIGESPVAPKFNIVSKPNDWIRTVRTSATSTELSEVRQTQLQFWTAFKGSMEGRSSVRCTKPQPQHWMNMSIGRSGFSLTAIASTWDQEDNTSPGVLRAEIIIDAKAYAKAYFAMLESDKAAIEQEVGKTLTWHNPEGTQSCKIYLRKTANITDIMRWPEQHAWLKENLELLQRVFAPRVKKLDASEAEGEGLAQ